MPIRRSKGRQRGIERGVQRHKIRGERSQPAHNNAASAGIEHLIRHWAESCCRTTTSLSQNLCIVPLVTGPDGRVSVAPLWRRGIHVTITLALGLSTVHKAWAAGKSLVV